MLSTTRITILNGIASGLGEREIAKITGTRGRAIKQHLNRMYTMLEVQSSRSMRLLVALWWDSLTEIEKIGAAEVEHRELRRHFEEWSKTHGLMMPAIGPEWNEEWGV